MVKIQWAVSEGQKKLKWKCWCTTQRWMKANSWAPWAHCAQVSSIRISCHCIQVWLKELTFTCNITNVFHIETIITNNNHNHKKLKLIACFVFLFFLMIWTMYYKIDFSCWQVMKQKPKLNIWIKYFILKQKVPVSNIHVCKLAVTWSQISHL